MRADFIKTDQRRTTLSDAPAVDIDVTELLIEKEPIRMLKLLDFGTKELEYLLLLVSSRFFDQFFTYTIFFATYLTLDKIALNL